MCYLINNNEGLSEHDKVIKNCKYIPKNNNNKCKKCIEMARQARDNFIKNCLDVWRIYDNNN